MKKLYLAATAFILTVLVGCASMLPHSDEKQTGSIVDYLYPDAKSAPQLQPSVTYLRPPIRVGVAFVPGAGWGNGPSEMDKAKLLERVKAAFGNQEFISSIEIIPTQYLRAKGGFENLDQVARMFNVEVITLLSYDQVQFNDTNELSVLYWTILGAYIIHGDKYDVQTLLDASVFDVKTRKLLFRAPGTSQIKGNASMSGFSEHSREARVEGFNSAVDNLIPQLQTELDKFRERVKTDSTLHIENKPGYHGGGDWGWLSLLIALALTAFLHVRTRRD